MLLSRFWYVILSLGVGAGIVAVFLATSVYNRASRLAMDQALSADTQVVGWYLNDDARRRSSLLLNVCLDETIRKQLSKASATADALPKEVTTETRTALRKLAEAMPQDAGFDAMFAVDQYGRVVGQHGYDQASGIPNFELGGYPVVADALHGWVRDDSWVLDDRIYFVVARPVEVDTAQMPAGAVVGLRLVDPSFVRQVSRRTGAAVAFYAGGAVRAKSAPEGFDPSQLDTIVSDVGNLAQDKDYQEKGRSKPKVLMGDVGVIYARIPGEAWDLGAGYAVGRTASVVESPLGFRNLADEADKKSLPWPLAGGVFAGCVLLGLLFSILEHSRPLHTLRVEAQRMAKGESDMLQVSKFRGVYRKIASDLNDGTDKVAAKGGVPRKAADLESVLGPIPAQPAMSAFAFPIEGGAQAPPGASPSSPGQVPAPKAVVQPPPPRAAMPEPQRATPVQPPAPMPMPKPQALKEAEPEAPAPVAPFPAPAPAPAAAPAAPGPHAAATGDDDATVVQAVPPEILEASATGEHRAVQEADEVSEWHNTYEEFVRTKKQCGEPVSGLTFEKFQHTLKKNRDQLIAKTGCKKVKFSVYVKDGRAALKASPVR
jgi:hypothetical protein